MDMMKKEIICCLVLLSCNLSIAAGEFSSLGVKLGYNSSRFTGADIPGKGVSSQAGLILGGFVSYKFDDVFSVQQEVLFTTKGSKINTIEDIYLSNTFVYLELPFLAKATFLTEYWLKPNVYVGPAVAVLITAFNDRYFLDDIRSFDLGGVIGASFEVWKVSLDLRLTKGLLNFDESADNIDLKNQTISIMAGYAF
jgi:hypothetical protein